MPVSGARATRTAFGHGRPIPTVRRRRLLCVILGLVGPATAGCLGEDGSATAAYETYDSAVGLVAKAEAYERAAHDDWTDGAWREAENRYNRARSGYRRAAGRFNEARGETTGCPSLEARADAAFAYCVRMERACEAWMGAAAARDRGATERATVRRAEGEEWETKADELAVPTTVDPGERRC